MILPKQNKIQEAEVTFFFNTGRNLKVYCSMRNWGCLFKKIFSPTANIFKNGDFLAFTCHAISIVRDEFWAQSQ